MRYTPRRKTMEEILKARGFTSVNRGYEKVITAKKNPVTVFGVIKKSKGVASTRLHALPVMDGGKIILELHLDEPHPEDKTLHKSRKFCKQVDKEIDEWKKFDVSDNKFVRFYDRLIKAINKAFRS